jgi:cobalt-zinc-cadmium efflux system outer membrane protein
MGRKLALSMVFVFPLSVSLAAGAQVLSEEEVMDAFRDQISLDAWVDSQDASARGAGLKKGQWRNPNLSFGHEAEFDPAGAFSGEAALTLALPLDPSGRLGLFRKAGKHRGRAARARGRMVQIQAEAAIRVRFYDALYWQDRLAVVEALFGQLVQGREKLEQRKRAGDVAPIALLRLDHELAIVASRVAVAKAEVNASRQALRLAALLSPAEVEVKGTLRPPLPADWARVAEGIENHPMADAFLAQEKALQADGDAADRWWIPRMVVQAGPRTRIEQDQWDPGYFLGMGLSLPIFNRRQGERMQALAKRKAMKTNRALAMANLHAEVRANHERLVELVTIANKLDDAVADKPLLEGMDALWEKGESSMLEYLDAHRIVANRALALLQQDREARLAEIRLTSLLAMEVQP